MNYQVGSKGSEVTKIQTRLKERGLYGGPLDGVFGGGTEAAVRKFQSANGLDVDGVVGPKTWAALFDGDDVPAPKIATKPLIYRCLGLTGSFETSQPIPECFAGLSGDFDDQGISFGALQWNFGQGSLPPLLKEMDQSHSQLFSQIFGANAAVLREVLQEDKADQVAWSRSIQSNRNVIFEPWRGQFKTLGRTAEFQKIQTKYATAKFDKAIELCRAYKLTSQRGVALMFDILTQNGSISGSTKAQILADYSRIPSGLSAKDKEAARLKIVATRRAQASNPRWVQDVMTRKLTIAEGEGVVHGAHYNLADQYGITLNDF